MLYSFSGDTRRLDSFEKILNFKFHRASLPTMSEIAQASAWYAAKKLEKVNMNAIDYFLPHARTLMQSLLQETDDSESGISIPHISDILANYDSNQVRDEVAPEQVEKLLARCLAALSNKNEIETRLVNSVSPKVKLMQADFIYLLKDL